MKGTKSSLSYVQCFLYVVYLKNIFYSLCYITVVPIFPLLPPPPSNLHSLWQFHPLLSSCPWVLHASSSCMLHFPILYLTSPWLFCTYQFVLLNPCTISPIIPLSSPNGNHPNEVHAYDSVSVLLVCFVCFLDSIVDSCKFIGILVFIVLIFFFLNKSL